MRVWISLFPPLYKVRVAEALLYNGRTAKKHKIFFGLAFSLGFSAPPRAAFLGGFAREAKKKPSGGGLSGGDRNQRLFPVFQNLFNHVLKAGLAFGQLVNFPLRLRHMIG